MRECELGIPGGERSGPPIMVGTTGERMLRLTAQYADLWNRWLVYANSDASEIPPLRDRVDAACEEMGRDPATLGRTTSVLVDFGNGQQDMPRHYRVRDIDKKPMKGSPGRDRDRLSQLQTWEYPISRSGHHHAPPAGIEMLAPVLELLEKG